jgi:hypothetical protein
MPRADTSIYAHQKRARKRCRGGGVWEGEEEEEGEEEGGGKVCTVRTSETCLFAYAALSY